MRIEQLEYVVAVTRHGSLRRASERLHVSLPALSEAITKLERELGVSLLDRRRSGARISRHGRDLLQPIEDVLEAVQRLRATAGDRRVTGRVVRIGTVNAATSTLLAPAVRAFQRDHPETQVEILTQQHAEVRAGLLEGSLDLGLVNILDGDDPPVDLTSTALLRGRPVAVLPAGHHLTAYAEVTVAQLRAERLVEMRSGYLMHRFVHRLFGDDLPPTRHTCDGAEMGKVMVAEGLGVTVIPDYSVIGDPLERTGLITARAIAGNTTAVTLVLQSRPAPRTSAVVHELTAALRAQAESGPARRGLARRGLARRGLDRRGLDRSERSTEPRRGVDASESP